MRVLVDKRLPEFNGYAVERTRGMYNVGVEDGSRFRLEAEIPVEREGWQIGVIVGPSGSGKTSISEELQRQDWQERTLGADDWGPLPIIEVLSEAASYAKATAALAAVGLGSVPAWLRPWAVLSNGEQFRANMAELLLSGAEGAGILLDEFTSVLDRQVARVGAGAFAKSWRKVGGRRVILITPHYDVLPAVLPDWIVDTAGSARLEGGLVEQEGEHAGWRGEFGGEEITTLQVGGGQAVLYEARLAGEKGMPKVTVG